MKKIHYLIFLLTIISCGSRNESSSYENNSEYKEESGSDYGGYEQEEYPDETYGFEDGTYSASVDYYNPSTGYSATYRLTVEVYNNQVTTIYFPNDGYLDEDHIWPDELDENGFVSIEGEDGKTYDIQIDY